MSTPLFDGSGVTKRAINLGGVNRSIETSHQELMQRAKREREERQQGRKRELAAVKIQAFYRGRREAYITRERLRQDYDSSMTTPSISASSASTPTSSSSDELILASRRLALFVTDSNQSDVKRLAAWCRAVLTPPRGAIGKTPALFSLYSSHKDNWPILVRQIASLLLRRAASNPNLPQTPLFVEIVKILCDVASFVKWKVVHVKGSSTPLEYLLARDFYGSLRKLILAIPINKSTHPALAATITLTLLPLKAFPPAPTTAQSVSTASATASTTRLSALKSFTREILTIELLTNRVAVASLTALVGMPTEDVLNSIALQSDDPLVPERSVQLLANLMAFFGRRVDSFTNSKSFVPYLTALRLLLEQVPASVFIDRNKDEEQTSAKGKAKEVDTIYVHDSDSESDDGGADEVVRRASAKLAVGTATQDEDGDVTMDDMSSSVTTLARPRSQNLTLDRRTSQSLELIASRNHIAKILTLSTRFSATSRPALASFLVVLMAAWPAKRDEVLNALMYSGGSSVNERGGGLLRELFRGYVRFGPLGRTLLGASQENRMNLSNISKSLLDPSLVTEWTVLVLLSELYSRCLHTMGDDEFYSARNPLTLDEVIGLSGMLRNLAFQLYWQEGISMHHSHDREIRGTKITLEAMRSLATGLLQQIHARDSRRLFTPQDHWLMTSQFDLDSFIQTVVLEDQKLEAEEEGTTSNDLDDQERHGVWPRRDRLVRRRNLATLTKREMAFISPRLGVLNNIPFVIPFETRVAMFRQFIDNDRARLGLVRYGFSRSRTQTVRIRRNHLASDAFQQMSGFGASIKGRVTIEFIDEHGMEESGIDGGGLFKELLTNLCKEAFDTDRGLWLETGQRELYPNPHAYAKEESQLRWFTFMGQILGKALYEGILIDVRFAGFFLAKWLGRQSYLDDLQTLDPELYSGLIQLKNYPGDVETDISLNFTVTDEDFGVSRTLDLIPGGSDIAVTNENRIRYIFLVSHYRLNVQLEKQCAAFFAGLSQIIPERFLRMFNQDELRILVGGVDQPIDIEDLKANTVYAGFEAEEANETIRGFWRIVESFNKEERSQLVKFATSCARPPLLGFKELSPKFCVRNAGSDQDRLPTSSTCVNLLKMSEYKDEENMRQKLLYAINSGAGFDLS